MPAEPRADTPAAPADTGRLLRQAGVVAGASGAAALLGYGLAHSLQNAGLAAPAVLGAAVGAVVAAVAVPLALWARVPQPPRVPRQWLKPVAAPAAPQATPAPKAQVIAMPTPAAVPSPPVAPVTAGPSAQRPVRDALTGAYTQQHFVAAADREWARLRRLNEDAALLMVDVDHFKDLNEQFGQACGDAVLVEITRQVSATLRQYDLLARFGGGVLVVYLPHTDPIGALDVAERIRERVVGFRLNWDGRTVKATVSVGVAGIGANHSALDDVITEAGAALREAKSAGRNCVRAAPIPPRRGAHNGSTLGAPGPAGKA